MAAGYPGACAGRSDPPIPRHRAARPEARTRVGIRLRAFLGAIRPLLAAATSSPGRRVVRHEQAVRLAAAMERLPPSSREVLLLRHFQELSFPEIASRMGRTMDGVKNLWIRALARLHGANWISSMNWIDRDDVTSECAGVDASELVLAVEAYQEALRGGRSVDRDAFLTEHAALGDRLGEYLDALELLQSVAGTSSLDRHTTLNHSPLEQGDVLGEFRIVREVARGGMGVVYEAEQLWLPQRRVALKVLLGSSSLDPRALLRFRVETRAAACLNHPNIVPVFAAGCERGIPFYSMPLIKGRSLAELLRTLRSDQMTSTPSFQALASRTGPEAPWPMVVARLGKQAAEVLEHAHSSGIIHRDIKPSNLIVDAEGRLWVTDFGLARLTGDDTGPTPHR